MSFFSTYDDVVAEVSRYLRYEKQISSRTFSRKKMKIMYKDHKKSGLAPTLGTSKEMIDHYTSTIPEYHKSNIYADIILNKYPREALCQYLLKCFPEEDFSLLKELHATLDYKNPLWQYWKSIGTVFGLGIALLNIVPEPVVVDVGLEYVLFEKSVFWLSLIVTVVAGFLHFPIWSAHKGIVQKRDYISHLFSRIIIIEKANKKVKNDAQ